MSVTCSDEAVSPYTCSTHGMQIIVLGLPGRHWNHSAKVMGVKGLDKSVKERNSNFLDTCVFGKKIPGKSEKHLTCWKLLTSNWNWKNFFE